jgi:hypothetical protein
MSGVKDFFPAGRSAGMRIVSNTFDMGDWNPRRKSPSAIRNRLPP